MLTPKIIHYEEIDSTNEEAKRLALQGETEPCLLLADRQTKGKGRMGRSFYSPDQTGIYCSLLYPDCPLQNPVTLTSFSAVCLWEAIAKFCHKETQIKWVNDLYYNGKKVCGILAEQIVIGEHRHLILGFGVNLTTKDFPEELIGVATSLGTAVDREAFVRFVGEKLVGYLDNPKGIKWQEIYRKNCYILGKEIKYFEREQELFAIAKDINEDGELILQTPEGEKILRTGEITVRLNS